jgi:putative endonuclease
MGLLRRLCRALDEVRHRARLKRLAAAHALGFRAEDLAHRYLQDHGYVVVERNWRPRRSPGEVDLIAYEGDALVFVEVKARSSDEIASPSRAIDEVKRIALRRAAAHYRAQVGVEPERVRFDLVTVVFRDPPIIELRRGALPMEPRVAVC